MPLALECTPAQELDRGRGEAGQAAQRVVVQSRSWVPHPESRHTTRLTGQEAVAEGLDVGLEVGAAALLRRLDEHEAAAVARRRGAAPPRSP